AADSRELGDAMRLDARLERGLDDAAGDGVVAATRAERGFRATVIGHREPDPVLVSVRRLLRRPLLRCHRDSTPSRSRSCTWSTMDWARSEEHTSELQSRFDLVCRLLLEKKKP